MHSISMTNLKYLKSSGLNLIYGQVDISTTPRDGIHIKSKVTNKSNVIVNASQCRSLKEKLVKSPVTDQQIYMYDQLGNMVSRLESGRKNNQCGNLGVNTDTQTLLSHMIIPNEPTSTNYIIIDNYSVLNEVSSEENKIQLLKEDINKLKEKSELSNVVVIIANSIHNVFIKLYPEYDSFFMDVINILDENVISYVAEHICGKIISGSKPSFQGFLNFGKDVDILRCIGDKSSITYTIRSGGKIQINSNKESVSGKILIFIKSESMSYSVKMTEELTNTAFEITPDMTIKPDTFPEIKFDTIITTMENINFGNNLNPSYDVINFIRSPTNYQKVMYYLFSNQPKINKEYEKLTDDSKLIVDIYNESFTDIKKIIVSHIYDNDSPGTPTPPGALGRMSSSAPHNYYAAQSGGPMHSAHYATPSYLGGVQSSLG